jgi:hypothetical protein
MRVVRISLFPPRFYLFGRRVHHGLIALVWLLTDWHDRHVWIRDLLKHPERR